MQGIVPRSRSRADAVLALTKFMKKFKFGRQQFVILESLFITEETHGDVFLSLESEREKHEFLMRRLEGFSFMHNMNNDQTNKVNPLTCPFSWFKDTCTFIQHLINGLIMRSSYCNIPKDPLSLCNFRNLEKK